METLNHYTRDLLNNCERSMAWATLQNAFSGSRFLPRRFLNGIALTSRTRNANGRSFSADGFIALELPMPLLWDHSWTQAIGKITAINAVGDELHFMAELSNKLSTANEIWPQLIERAACGVSMGSFSLKGEPCEDEVYKRFGIREISLTDNAADRGTRVTKVFERSNVVSLRGEPSEIIYWDSGESKSSKGVQLVTTRSRTTFPERTKTRYGYLHRSMAIGGSKSGSDE